MIHIHEISHWHKWNWWTQHTVLGGIFGVRNAYKQWHINNGDISVWTLSSLFPASSSLPPTAVMSVCGAVNNSVSERCLTTALPAVSTHAALMEPQVLAFLIMMAILAICGCGGNLLILLYFPTRQRHAHITHFFIHNLAVVDLATCAVMIPFSALFELSLVRVDGLCQAMQFLCHVTISDSLFTLLGVAMERYIAICHPFHTFSKRQAIGVIVINLVLSIGFAMPTIFVYRVYWRRSVWGVEAPTCWPVTTHPIFLYYGLALLLGFASIVLTMLILYTRLYCTIYWRHRSHQGHHRDMDVPVLTPPGHRGHTPQSFVRGKIRNQVHQAPTQKMDYLDVPRIGMKGKRRLEYAAKASTNKCKPSTSSSDTIKDIPCLLRPKEPSSSRLYQENIAQEETQQHLNRVQNGPQKPDNLEASRLCINDEDLKYLILNTQSNFIDFCIPGESSSHVQFDDGFDLAQCSSHSESSAMLITNERKQGDRCSGNLGNDNGGAGLSSCDGHPVPRHEQGPSQTVSQQLHSPPSSESHCPVKTMKSPMAHGDILEKPAQSLTNGAGRLEVAPRHTKDSSPSDRLPSSGFGGHPSTDEHILKNDRTKEATIQPKAALTEHYRLAAPGVSPAVPHGPGLVPSVVPKSPTFLPVIPVTSSSSRAAQRQAVLISMLFGVTLIFIISWLPFWLTKLKVITYDPILHYFFFFNNATNIFVYLIFNHSFRKSLSEKICC